MRVPIVQLDDECRGVRRQASERGAVPPEPECGERVEQRAVVRAVQMQFAPTPLLQVVLLLLAVAA